VEYGLEKIESLLKSLSEKTDLSIIEKQVVEFSERVGLKDHIAKSRQALDPTRHPEIAQLPESIVHGDFHQGNFRFPGTFDFEFAHRDKRILDLTAPVTLRFNDKDNSSLVLEKVEGFIIAYDDALPASEKLTEHELDLLPEVFRLHYLQDIHYKGRANNPEELQGLLEQFANLKILDSLDWKSLKRNVLRSRSELRAKEKPTREAEEELPSDEELDELDLEAASKSKEGIDWKKPGEGFNDILLSGRPIDSLSARRLLALVQTERNKNKILSFHQARLFLKILHAPNLPESLREEVWDYLILKNRPLAIMLSNQYKKGKPVEDADQNAVIGLMKGIVRYDPEVTTKLSDYVSWWIINAIKKGIYPSRPFDVPSQGEAQVEKVKKAEGRLGHKFGREISVEELSEETGYRPDRVQQTRVWRKGSVAMFSRSIEEGGELMADLNLSEGDVPYNPFH